MNKYVERFYSKTREAGDCLVWAGYLNEKGYPYFYDGQRMRRAHRYIYESMIGTIADGLQIDHLCRNRACVRLSHLETVTHKENCQRGIGSKTHCKNGHEFDEQNTGYAKTQRYCIKCNRASSKAYRLSRPRKGRTPRTHCPSNHPYEAGNIYINSKGHRECLICNRASKRRYQEKIKRSRAMQV